MVKRKKEDFSNYMNSALQNSMLTGIPQIASASNMPKKITRTLVFIVCMGGFIYQSLTFMSMYWEYKTIVDVKVLNPLEEFRPSMTFCTNNGLMLTEVCNDEEAVKYNIKCEKLENTEGRNWCECLPRYCVLGELGDYYDAPLKNLSQIVYLPYEVRKKWLQPYSEAMYFCREFNMIAVESQPMGCRDFPFIEIGCPNSNKYPEYCVTMHNSYGQPNKVLDPVMSDGKILYEVAYLGMEAPTALGKLQWYGAIHNPYTILNPFIEGYRMEPDFQYYFHLKKIVKILLPKPYETDCMDYLEMWRARGGMGPTTKKECIQECRKNLSLSRYGCLLETLRMPGYELRCPPDIVDNALFDDAKICSEENCKSACYEEHYAIDKEVTSFVAESPCDPPDPDPEPPISLAHVQLDGMETTVYSYSPKFEDIETFSYLGGYVGMWLGISLVAVFDFLETVVLMAKYPVRRYLQFKAKRTRVENLKRARRNL